MSDPLTDAITRAVRAEFEAHTRPANDRPEVLASAEAKARGFKSTESFLAWCASRGVPVRPDGAKLRWVSPEEVSRVVRGLPAVEGRPLTPEQQARQDALAALGG